MKIQLVTDRGETVLVVDAAEAFDEYGQIREELVDEFENYTTERFVQGRHVGFLGK